ncbi:hypothetical protein B0H11DRAFT_1646579, partial [Mycena galericulata]
QEARVAALQAEVDTQASRFYTNSAPREHEDAEAITKKHIKLLHRYNEAKDATQV